MTHCELCLEDNPEGLVQVHEKLDHFYHIDCLKQWYEHSGKFDCPSCSLKMKPEVVLKIVINERNPKEYYSNDIIRVIEAHDFGLITDVIDFLKPDDTVLMEMILLAEKDQWADLMFLAFSRLSPTLQHNKFFIELVSETIILHGRLEVLLKLESFLGVSFNLKYFYPFRIKTIKCLDVIKERGLDIVAFQEHMFQDINCGCHFEVCLDMVLNGIWSPGARWDYFLTECVLSLSHEGISYLLDHKPERITEYGTGAVQHAILFYNDPILVKSLIERGCKVGDPFSAYDQEIAGAPSVELVEYLISHGLDVTAHNDTLLRIAFHFNHVELITYLLNIHNTNPCCIDYLPPDCTVDSLKLIFDHPYSRKHDLLVKACELRREDLIALIVESGDGVMYNELDVLMVSFLPTTCRNLLISKGARFLCMIVAMRIEHVQDMEDLLSSGLDLKIFGPAFLDTYLETGNQTFVEYLLSIDVRFVKCSELTSIIRGNQLGMVSSLIVVQKTSLLIIFTLLQLDVDWKF